MEKDAQQVIADFRADPVQQTAMRRALGLPDDRVKELEELARLHASIAAIRSPSIAARFASGSQE